MAAFRLPVSVAGRPQILGAGGEGGGPCGKCPTEAAFFGGASSGAYTYEYAVTPPIPTVQDSVFGAYSMLLYPTDTAASQANVTARAQLVSDGMGHNLPRRSISSGIAPDAWLKGAIVNAHNGGDNAACQAVAGGRYGRLVLSVTLINYHSPNQAGKAPCNRDFSWVQTVLHATYTRAKRIVDAAHAPLQFVIPPTAVPATPTPIPAPTYDTQANNSLASDEGGTGPTAACNDGTTSYSAHPSGTCSHHGGVAVWDDDLPHTTP